MGSLEHFKTLLSYELPLPPHGRIGDEYLGQQDLWLVLVGVTGRLSAHWPPAPYMESLRLRVHSALERIRCLGVLTTFQKLSSDQGY